MEKSLDDLMTDLAGSVYYREQDQIKKARKAITDAFNELRAENEALRRDAEALRLAFRNLMEFRPLTDPSYYRGRPEVVCARLALERFDAAMRKEG